MHLLSTRPGGFVDDNAGVVRIAQSPAQIVVLSAADTTLSLLAGVFPRLGEGFPTVRLANQMYLRQPASLDMYVDDVLQHARVVVVDHLGGDSDWPYGLERLTELARSRNQLLVMFSGDLAEDANLLGRGNAPQALASNLWRYLREGGADNAEQFFRCLAHHAFGWGEPALQPRVLPQAAIYHPAYGVATAADWQREWAQDGHADAPVVALVFYRAHLQAGNTAVFDALIAALRAQGMNPLPLAVNSLKDTLCREVLQHLCAAHGAALVLNTTAFAASSLDAPETLALAGDAPVLQVILSGGNREDWLQDSQGLGPRDVAMHIAMPEVDGRIITRAVSFKGLAYRCPHTEVDVVRYQPDAERIAFVAELSRRWCRLRQLDNADKRVALVLANYPANEGRIGNGVGLDTPASVVGILGMLREQGYHCEGLPADGDDLMRGLTQGITNDPTHRDLRPAFQSLSMADYLAHLSHLPADNQRALAERWGSPDQDPMVRQGRFMIAGVRSGHLFVGLQPARAYALPGEQGSQSYASYHDADLVPPHGYLAFYFWLRQAYGAHALIHVGKHGNLEWLPGKGVGLSENCWPDALLGPLPNIYPFIVNDPGEGAQAKRRTQAVIIDHLMPPLTRAETYGPLRNLELLADEYYEAQLLDPRRARELQRDILRLVRETHIDRELQLEGALDSDADAAIWLPRLDTYLCDLKESQIRDGLHVFGESPEGRLRLDTLLALLRIPRGDGKGAHASLLRALAKAFELGFDPLDCALAEPWTGRRPQPLRQISEALWRTAGDVRERLELYAAELIEAALQGPVVQLDEPGWEPVQSIIDGLREVVAPRLDACGPAEMHGLLEALNGRFVPAGPSGAPSRGRLDVLPTGRNFYSVDVRNLPTTTAWRIGFQSANLILERHLQDHGDHLLQLGLSVWGTATMRTGGDDIAQAMALMGVRPVWASGSQRVDDFEILPLSLLDRPRVDVTLRVSGFLDRKSVV